MSSNEWSSSGAARPLAGVPSVEAGRLTGGLAACGLVALAFLLRLVWLDADAHIDELYHLLAAEGWLRTGAPTIADGVYDRAVLFTALLALCLDAFGQTLEIARLPSVIAGTALVLALFVWTRRAAGPLAAWAAALLLALSPLAVEISQLARFYALHALAFWLAAVCLWHATQARRPARERVAMATLSLLCTAFALHLQQLTMIGAVGLAVWLAGLWAPAIRAWLRPRRPGRLALGGAVVIAGLVVAALAVQLGMLEKLLERYRFAPLWAAEFRNQVHFYHLRLLAGYPIFWPLTPLALLAAVAAWPRAAAFCATVFGTTFALASFAGMKDDRYLFFALPFLFALWGMGFAATFARLRGAVLGLADAARTAVLPSWPVGPTRHAAVVAVLGFMFLASGAPARLAMDLATGDAPSGPGRVSPEWARAGAALAPRLERAEVVVVSNELAALRHLGRTDVVVSGSRLSELDDVEFGRDPRTGVAVIGGPAAFRDLVRCHAEGLVVVSARDLAFDWSVPTATRAAIAGATTPVPLPGFAELRAYRWRNDDPQGTGCPAATTARPGD